MNFCFLKVYILLLDLKKALLLKLSITLEKSIKRLLSVISSKKFSRCLTVAIAILLGTATALAQVSTGGDYSQGISAMQTVTVEIAKYVPVVVQLCYAIAGVVGVVGAISVYIAMNNDEQDVKKKIMMVVGACIFLIAAAQALPLFFGIEV